MAVVIRRGPSKLVQLLKWDLTNDYFEKGQWFKGRIYEHYCDLSPTGKYLVYWAGNHKEPYYQWTAVSRPPYLTALTMWPSYGPHGGGVFERENYLRLTDYNYHLGLGNEWPKNLKIDSWTGDFRVPLGYITEARLDREGWRHTQQGASKVDKNEAERKKQIDDWLKGDQKSPPPSSPKYTKGRIYYPLDPIDIWRKRSGKYDLELRALGFGKINGPWHVQEYSVFNATTNNIVRNLGNSDWADWDKNGDLLYANSGCIFRVPAHQMSGGEPILLIDLSTATFEPLEAPETFKQW